MPWGAAIGAVGGLIGSSMQSSASSDAADTSAAAQLEGIESQERMFDKSLALNEPFREAGYDAISGLQGMQTTDGRAALLNDFYAGDEYKAYETQATEAALRNAAATGNLRGGVTQASLATIAPQLGADYLSSYENNLTGLANLGIGAASQGSSQATALGSSIAQSQANIGNVKAQNSIAQGNIWADATGDMAGFASDYFN